MSSWRSWRQASGSSSSSTSASSPPAGGNSSSARTDAAARARWSPLVRARACPPARCSPALGSFASVPSLQWLGALPRCHALPRRPPRLRCPGGTVRCGASCSRQRGRGAPADGACCAARSRSGTRPRAPTRARPRRLDLICGSALSQFPALLSPPFPSRPKHVRGRLSMRCPDCIPTPTPCAVQAQYDVPPSGLSRVRAPGLLAGLADSSRGHALRLQARPGVPLFCNWWPWSKSASRCKRPSTCRTCRTLVDTRPNSLEFGRQVTGGFGHTWVELHQIGANLADIGNSLYGSAQRRLASTDLGRGWAGFDQT